MLLLQSVCLVFKVEGGVRNCQRSSKAETVSYCIYRSNCMCICDLSMMILLQVQRRMTFTEKNGKKTNMTHTNVNQINDSNMHLVQVLMESSVYAFVQNHI